MSTSFEYDMEYDEFPINFEKELFVNQISLAEESIEDLERSVTEEKEFFALSRAAQAYLTLDNLSKAKEAAKRSLEISEYYKDSWNYGNSTHNSNIVLGILAFDKGNIKKAKSFLVKAGCTNGSPQLNSFGPNMQLAKRLLLVGEYEVVLEYLEKCETFWTNGSAWLGIWKEKISKREIPNFYMHLFT